MSQSPLQLPPPFANAAPFSLTERSRFDERGPAWYWNDISTSEHTGTHFDAPVHWITGRDGEDVAQVPVGKLVAPAVVLDFSAESAKDPDFLLEVDHVRAWEAEHGPLPDGGWLLYRTGWDARSEDAASFLNANETGPHTPGISVECAQWLAEEAPVIGVGVETVGTDAGAAHSFDPAFPCHSFLLAADTGAAAVRSNFQIDQDALVTAVGAVAEWVHAPASAAADAVRAYRTAVEQRRTVVLNLPLDVQAAPAPDGPLPAVPELAPVRAGAVDDLVALLDTAERPVFVAGRGARSAGRELRALGTAAGALLATSAVATARRCITSRTPITPPSPSPNSTWPRLGAATGSRR